MAKLLNQLNINILDEKAIIFIAITDNVFFEKIILKQDVHANDWSIYTNQGWWRRKKSHLLRYSNFSATQDTTRMISCLKNHYALPNFMVLVELLS